MATDYGVQFYLEPEDLTATGFQHNLTPKNWGTAYEEQEY